MGADAQINSWDVVFKPEILSKFKDCGIHMLDSPDDILPAALNYLGLDPNSSKQADLDKAAALVTKVRPFVRKFHSSEYISALASGEICFVVGWSGDIKQAQSRAEEAKNGVEIAYAIPKEGAQMFFDNLAIPKDAKNVAEAYELINYLYRPDVAAKNSSFLSLRQRQSRSAEADRAQGHQRPDGLSRRGDDEAAVRHYRARCSGAAHDEPHLDPGEDGQLI